MSERSIASISNLNRETVRKAISGDQSITLNNFTKITKVMGVNHISLLVDKKKPFNSSYSIPIISQNTMTDSNWKIHFFDFVDYFRKNPDERLILLPPVPGLGEKEAALLKSIVCSLCDEKGLDIPEWAKETHWLKEPWFVSGFKSLMATSILESPVYFRRNNIWVLANFMSRA